MNTEKPSECTLYFERAWNSATSEERALIDAEIFNRPRFFQGGELALTYADVLWREVEAQRHGRSPATWVKRRRYLKREALAQLRMSLLQDLPADQYTLGGRAPEWTRRPRVVEQFYVHLRWHDATRFPRTPEDTPSLLCVYVSTLDTWNRMTTFALNDFAQEHLA